jgi:hypothetical protein
MRARAALPPDVSRACLFCRAALQLLCCYVCDWPLSMAAGLHSPRGHRGVHGGTLDRAGHDCGRWRGGGELGRVLPARRVQGRRALCDGHVPTLLRQLRPGLGRHCPWIRGSACVHGQPLQVRCAASTVLHLVEAHRSWRSHAYMQTLGRCWSASTRLCCFGNVQLHDWFQRGELSLEKCARAGVACQKNRRFF